jgi:hypothetical protein
MCRYPRPAPQPQGRVLQRVSVEIAVRYTLSMAGPSQASNQTAPLSLDGNGTTRRAQHPESTGGAVPLAECYAIAPTHNQPEAAASWCGMRSPDHRHPPLETRRAQNGARGPATATAYWGCAYRNLSKMKRSTMSAHRYEQASKGASQAAAVHSEWQVLGACARRAESMSSFQDH